jgi:hypothetical protein
VKRACNECRQQKVSHEASRQSHGVRLDDEAIALEFCE